MFITHISHERVEMLGAIGVMVLQNEMAVNCGRFSRVRVRSGDPKQQICNLPLAVGLIVWILLREPTSPTGESPPGATNSDTVSTTGHAIATGSNRIRPGVLFDVGIQSSLSRVLARPGRPQREIAVNAIRRYWTRLESKTLRIADACIFFVALFLFLNNPFGSTWSHVGAIFLVIGMCGLVFLTQIRRRR
jgi:hypothetical protein